VSIILRLNVVAVNVNNVNMLLYYINSDNIMVNVEVLRNIKFSVTCFKVDDERINLKVEGFSLNVDGFSSA